MDINLILEERNRQIIDHQSEEDLLFEDAGELHEGITNDKAIHHQIKFEQENQARKKKFHKQNLLKLLEMENSKSHDEIFLPDINSNIEDSPINKDPNYNGFLSPIKNIITSPSSKNMVIKITLSPDKKLGPLAYSMDNQLYKILSNERNKLFSFNQCANSIRKMVGKDKKMKDFVHKLDDYEKGFTKAKEKSVNILDRYEQKAKNMRIKYKKVYEQKFIGL